MEESSKPIINNHFAAGSIVIYGGDVEGLKKALQKVFTAETEQPDCRTILKATLEPFCAVLAKAFKDSSFRERLPDLLASLDI